MSTSLNMDINKKLDKCTRLICSVEKNGEVLTLKDYDEEAIWNSNSEVLLQVKLRVKSNRYAKKYNIPYNQENPCVWVLKVIPAGTGVTENNKYKGNYYKNVAVCISTDRMMKEINGHIYELVNKKIKTDKAKKYRDLWSNGIKSIEFREVDIDSYINSINVFEWSAEDDYIKTLVFPDCKQKTEQAQTILMKIRAAYIEGRIAYEFNMKDEGVWNPSGYGIDEDIYKYYSDKYPK